MALGSKRHQQISDLLNKAIAQVLSYDIQDQRLKAATVTALQLSPDYRHADVYYTVLDTGPQADQIQHALAQATGFISCCLAKRVSLRYLPKLHFKYDASIDRAHHILGLIKAANQPVDECVG